MQASITSLLPSPETSSRRLPFGPTTAIEGQLRTPMRFHSCIVSSFTTGWAIS